MMSILLLDNQFFAVVMQVCISRLIVMFVYCLTVFCINEDYKNSY